MRDLSGGASGSDEHPDYQIDEDDPLIPERAELLGMDEQDFREFLMLATHTRDVLAVESSATTVDRLQHAYFSLSSDSSDVSAAAPSNAVRPFGRHVRWADEVDDDDGDHQHRNAKNPAKQPLVRVHIYDLHGTMIMGVARVGQWRGWLWLAAYFAYHILIEYSASTIVSVNDEEHGRLVLCARAYGAVIAMLIALVYVAIARCVKSRPPSRSRTAWSRGANGMILMGACGMLFGAFEAFFWGSLHSKYKNGALVVYPTIFLGPVITVLLRRPFFPARYHQNVSQNPDRVRVAGSTDKVVYKIEALSCGIVLLGSLVMCFSFPGTVVDWIADMALQLFACIAASTATVCLAVLSQRGLLSYSIIAITACRAFGFFALMLTNEIGLHQDSSSFLTKVAPVLWLALLMGIDYIMFLVATMRSNQHLDIMAVVVLMSLSNIEVPVLSVLLSPNDDVDELGVIDPQWKLWLGIALVVLGCVGLGVFATLRQQFVMYEMWQKGELLLKPKRSNREQAGASSSSAGCVEVGASSSVGTHTLHPGWRSDTSQLSSALAPSVCSTFRSDQVPSVYSDDSGPAHVVLKVRR